MRPPRQARPVNRPRRWRRPVSRRWRSSPRTATRLPGHWPKTSSAGWPTSRFGGRASRSSCGAAVGPQTPDGGGRGRRPPGHLDHRPGDWHRAHYPRMERGLQAQRDEARVQGPAGTGQAVHLLTKVADSGFDEQLDPPPEGIPLERTGVLRAVYRPGSRHRTGGASLRAFSASSLGKMGDSAGQLGGRGKQISLA